MGSFSNYPATSINFSGGPWYPQDAGICGTGFPGSYTLHGFNVCNPGVAGVGTVTGSTGNTTILTDDGEVSILNLPVGFHITEAFYDPNFNVPAGINSTWAIQFSGGIGGIQTGPTPYLITDTVILNCLGLNTFIHDFNTGPTSGAINQNASSSFGPGVFGTYEILVYTWTIEGGPPFIPAPGPFNPGDTIKVHSPDLLPDLTTINEFQFIFLNSDNEIVSFIIDDFDIQTPTLIQFVLDRTILNPILGEYTSGSPISIFGGSVKITNIELAIINPSGVYKLVTNKRHDTLYNDSANGSDTTDIAIPTPFVKTGFIGG